MPATPTSVPLNHVFGMRILVVGMGVSGLETAKALKQAGAHVTLTDDAHKTIPEIPCVAPHDINPRDFDLFVLSPGIAHKAPNPHPLVQKAYDVGVPLSSDIDLFFQAHPKALTIGVSGTNRKSSTVSLIHFTLQKLNTRAVLGGNIGVPILTLPWLESGDAYVIELSSYQLETTPHLALDIAILLAITPDHLERYQTMEHYANAKFALFSGPKGVCLYDAHDPWQQDFIKHQKDKERFIPYGVGKHVENGFCLVNNQLHNTYKGACTVLDIPKSCAHIPGPTLLCTFATLILRGFEGLDILKAIENWPGLSHRCERVTPPQNSPFALCTWINDSKATNVESACFALSHHRQHPLFWIAGGRLKDHSNFDLWKPFLPHVTHVFLIGEGSDVLANFLSAENVPYTHCQYLEAAIDAVYRQAQSFVKENPKGPKPVVLFSPAGASFDQYTNFGERGNHFKALILGDKRP